METNKKEWRWETVEARKPSRIEFNINDDVVGGWNISGDEHKFLFNITKKPSLINRFFVKILFGWKWEDKK